MFDLLNRVKANDSKERMESQRERHMAAARDDVLGLAAQLVYEISPFDSAIAANPPGPKFRVTSLNRGIRLGRGKGQFKRAGFFSPTRQLPERVNIALLHRLNARRPTPLDRGGIRGLALRVAPINADCGA